jgi:hypothetical protein
MGLLHISSREGAVNRTEGHPLTDIETGLQDLGAADARAVRAPKVAHANALIVHAQARVCARHGRVGQL